MSDEEKKAIETIKDFKNLKWYEHAFDNGTEVLDEEQKQDIDTILNLIEKQSKEIEELKRVDISNSQIIANMSTRHFNDREKIRKYESLVDKIKAKIEELDYNDIGNFERRCKQEVLQSLLEKE